MIRRLRARRRLRRYQRDIGGRHLRQGRGWRTLVLVVFVTAAAAGLGWLAGDLTDGQLPW